jgi:alkylhydroperoxidase family enzyme
VIFIVLRYFRVAGGKLFIERNDESLAASLFTDRERAALAWTEAVTLIGKDHVPDEVFELARSQFSEKELVDLTLAVIAINNWNRLAISFRAVPGSYQRPVEMKTGTR